MIKEDKVTLYNTFMKELTEGRVTAKSKWKEGSYGDIYSHLFEMLPTEDFKQTLTYTYDISRGNDKYYGKDGKEGWFFSFHKSIRQCDFYDNIFATCEQKLLSDDEASEYKFLRTKVFDKTIVKKSEVDGELWTEEYNRYKELLGKVQREKQDYEISGRMDSILWNMIHIDEGFLHGIMEMTFAKWDVIKQNVKLKQKA